MKYAFRYHLQKLCRVPHCVNSLVLYLNSPAKNDGTSLLWDLDEDGIVSIDWLVFTINWLIDSNDWLIRMIDWLIRMIDFFYLIDWLIYLFIDRWLLACLFN